MEDAAHTMNNGGHAEEAGVFRCPLCAQALQNDGKRLFCARGHSFDLSREGYVNLLPGRGGAHGDDRGMIEARRRFLEGGHYLPLRLTLCRRAAESAPRALLDAGCGEGWYTEGLANALPETEICAVDVSKDAVRYTAKRLGKRARCAVSAFPQAPARCVPAAYPAQSTSRRFAHGRPPKKAGISRCPIGLCLQTALRPSRNKSRRVHHIQKPSHKRVFP